ncbi:TPA: type I secretion C-terminal target domain-containing protein, partial [Enterobacter cloacae subsp. cloacae]|nr:type I secretion C-terminal target domain-containing protein [Enterobacter cloacae subsp. cloacae]HDT6095473.1 type I secretion C-terminal target domain-containing protein [Enterobacter cloacae subsp. cloacae]
ATDDIDPGKGTVSSGGSTNDPRPQLSGTAEPGSTVTIYDGSVAIGTAVTGSNGTWTFTPSVNLGESTHQFTVRATDAAGNTGPASPVFTLTVDLTPPATPTAIVLSDETGAIKGAITAGQFTDSSEPLLAGRGEPGATTLVYDNGVLIGQTTVLPNGTWSLRPDNPLAEGPHSITIKQTDAAGNQSAESQPVNFTVDTTPPALPVIAINPVGTQVTGTAEPGSKIVITNSNGEVIGRATTDGNGNFVATLSPAQTNGEQLSVVATDAAGNQSPAASLTAPDTTPDILSVVDDQPGVTGPISQNGITNDRTPTLNGTAEPGSTITIHSGGDVLGTVVVPSSGQWTFTPSTPLAEGAHVLTATSSNGNVSNAWTITIDGTAPDAPAITQLVDNVPGGTGPVDVNDTTNDATPTLNGTGEPGSTITIRLDGVDIGTAVVGSSGAWTFTPTTPVGDGAHTLTAIATDVAGNTSPVSGGFTFTVDTTPPPVATLATVTDDAGDVKGPLSSGDTTDDTQPLLQGSAPDGTVITVYDGTTLLGTATLDGSGGWSFTPTTPLTDGPHSLTIHATDAAGNTSISDPFELVIDTVAPATPDTPAITVNPDGSAPTSLNPGETTRDTTPTLSGTGNPGDTVTIYNGTDKIGDAVVDGDGNWSWTPSTDLPNGTYDITLTVTNKDGAGNESAPSQPVTITIDTDAPAAPAVPVITDSVSQITGPVADGETINDPRPVLSGTGTPNDVITIYDSVDGGTPTAVGTVTVDGNGNWSWRPESAIDEGSHEFTATATDEAGNVSDPSTGITITVDTLAPDTPVIGAIAGEPNGGVTTDTTPTVGGTGVTGETVIVYNNGVELGRVVVANGEWSFTLPTQTDGPLNITVAAVDAAGNVSALSPVFTVTVDTTAPEIPLINSVEDSQLTNGTLYTRDGTPTLNGTGEPGSTVIVSVDGTPSTVLVTVQPDGTWSWTADTTLAEGPHSFTVSSVDPAGNASGSSAPLAVTVDTVLPAAPDNISVAAQGTPLTGTGEEGATIIVTDASGNVIGTGVVSGGNFSVALSPAQQDGAALTITATDAAGNLSPEASYTVTGTQPNLPDVPVITVINDDTAPVTGDVKDKTTNDTTPTLVGTAEPGSIITVYQDGVQVLLPTVTADANGNWSYTPALPLGEGAHTFEVTATLNGETSGRSPVATVTVDLTAPDAPAIGAVIDDVGPGTGPLTDGQTTNDNRPTLTGSGTAGDTISIYSNGTLLGTTVVGQTGNWSFTPSALAEGNNVLTIRETDPAGNQSAPSAGFTIVVDTSSTTPVIVNVTDDVGNTATTVVSGNTTNDATPTLSGTAEANSVVTIFDGNTQIGIVTADGTGAWSFTPETALVEGSHSFTVKATDPQGNVSLSSNAWSVVVDLTAPAVPVLETVSDNVAGGIVGNLTTGQVTNDTTPTLSGTGAVGSTIHILNNGVEIGTAPVDSNGNWSILLTTTLATGPHSFTAQATDAAGNTSAPSATFNLTIDTTPPAQPVLSSIVDDVGNAATPVANGGLTNDAQPTLTGTAEAGATVKIFDNGVQIGSVVATGGNWSFTPSPALSDGQHSLTFTATDAAGNASAPTTGYVINVDATAPAAPLISAIVDDVGSVTGPVTGNNPTNDTQPALSGTAEANATVRIYDGSTLVGTVTADANGNWTLAQTTTTLTEGSHSFTATATDAVGNTSAPSTVTTILVDLTAPGAPTSLQVIANGTQVTGTAEAGSTVTITSGNGTVLGTATADGNGNFSATLTTAQTNGEALLVYATDKAGNAGVSASVVAPSTNIPNAPVIANIDDNVGSVTGGLTNGKTTDDTTPTLSGTAQPNATVTLYNNGVSMGTVVADASGNWSFTTPALSEGSHAFTATATNSAGTSPISLSTTVIVDVTAPNAPAGTFNADGSVLTGTAEAGSTVTIRLADGSTVTTTADSNGAYSYTFLNKQTEGQTLQITATDAAGNTSQPGSVLAPVVPLSASNNVEELDLSTTATVTNSQYSDYGFLLVGAVGNVLTLLGNDTAQVEFNVGSGGSADIVVNANATGAVLSLLNTLELVVQRFDTVNNTWTTVVDTGQPQFADLLTLGATGVSLNLTGLADGQYRVLSYNTNLLATGSYTSLDVAVKETSAGTVTGDTSLDGNVILDTDPTAGSDNAPAGTTVSAVTNALGVTTSVNADGTVIQGQYGTLTINRDGSYTYNLTDTSAAVIGRTESFTYTITHNGVSASANLVLSLGSGSVANGIVAVDDAASLTFDTTVQAIDNGTSSQSGFTLVGINLGNTLGLNLLDDMTNPIIYTVEEGTTRTMTIQASVGGVALASVFDLYVYKFNNATQTFEQMRVEPGWLRAPLLGGTSSQLTLNLPAGEYLFLLNTAAGITALTAYTLSVLQDHVYSVSSIGESTTGDVLANDPVPDGTVVTEVNGVTVNSSGTTDIQGEYGTLTIDSSGQYTYTLNSGVGADHISTPDTFVYTITAPNGAKDTGSLNITPTARAMDAVNDVSTEMSVTSVHHTSAYSDTTVGSASWTTSLLGTTTGSGSGTFVVDPNTALHSASLHFDVASLLALGGLTVNWTISDANGVIRTGSFSGGSLLGGSIDVPLTGLDLNAGTYTLSYTGSVPGLSVGNITITPSVNGTTYSLTQFDSTSGHTVDGNIFDGTDSAGAMDQLQSVDTRVTITGFDGTTTTLDPYTGSTLVNVTGHYGTLSIGADGHYTYTLNSGVSLSTITSKEVFNYTLTDANGNTDTATLTINMAPQFVSSEHNDVITGTAYGDTLIYQVLNSTAGNATAGNVSSTAGDHWTNFSLAQGDKIDIGDLLVGWNGSASTLGNYLHVTNSNGSTVISIDRDGTGSTYTNTTLVTLDNVQTTYDELVNQQHIVT